MSNEVYRVAIIGSAAAGPSATANASEMGVSRILTKGEPQVSDTILRSQKGKHVLHEPGILTLHSPFAFTASKREVGLGNWESRVRRYRSKLPGWYDHSTLLDIRVSLLNYLTP